MTRSTSKKHIPRGKTYFSLSYHRKGLLRWILLGIFAVIFVIFFLDNQSVPKMISLMRERTKLKQEKILLEEDIRKLEEEIHKLKTDDNYIEKIAREKYNMKKEEEDVYTISPQ